MRTHRSIADLNPGWGARHDREEGHGVGGKMGNQQRRNNPHRRERTRIQDGRAWLWAAMVVGLWFGASRVSAQTTITLVEYTNVWKYSATGTDLGTGWRSNSFDDSAWPSGRGILGVESVPANYTRAPFNTTFSNFTRATITYYFRTHFNFPTNPCGVTLMASNYIDDGAVIFLNGVEMARFRVPIDQTAGILASAGPAVEGQNDVAMYAPTPGALQPGDNVLAVEVHQINTTSADVVWAMNLTARFSAVPPVAITSQPQSITTAQDHASTLAVAAAGAFPAYQWQRDNGGGVFTNILDATASVFFIASTQPANAGAYRVIVGNCAGSQTSSVAMLMVVPDLQGPRLVSAVANAAVNGLPRSILVAFDEPVTNVTDIANYSITSTPPGHSLIISNAVGDGFTLVQLRTSPWLTNTDYILTVNHVRDKSPAGNVIAPDSQIGVSFYRDIFHLDQPWVWEDSGTDLGTAWTARDYDDGWWCGRPAAPGVFYFDLTPPLCGERLTHVRFGPNTYYFRTHFNIRPTTGRASVILTHVLDDGAVFYLNGTELNRYNIAAGEVTYATPATTEIASAVCMTTTALPVNNLLTGDNVLAVEVHQFSPSSALNSDMTFGLQLAAAVQPLLPSEPFPVLALARQGTNLTLSWQGHGYALEFATNLSGAWFPMPNTANPFNATAGDAARFFRLRRPQ